MAHTLQRCLGPVRCLEAGQYTVETMDGAPVVCCPTCGEIHPLLNAVLPGGLVRYEWRCPTGGCPFKAFITLEAFDEPVV
jgi:hypothetical protein